MSHFMILASDSPFTKVPFPPDYVYCCVDPRIIDDDGQDDGFGIFPQERLLELPSEKEYFAEFVWDRYTPGRAKNVIAYFKKHLETADGIEFWNVLLNMDFDHRVRKAEIPIETLIPEDLQEFHQLEPWLDPITDFCYVIT